MLASMFPPIVPESGKQQVLEFGQTNYIKNVSVVNLMEKTLDDSP